jgi:hypothetical protein
MSKRRKQKCYYCGAIASSVEHAPPRQMFRGYTCDSITVPACDRHNTRKSGDDQSIISAFLIALQEGASRYPLEPEIRDAIERGVESFARVKRKVTRAPLVGNPPKSVADLPKVAHISPSAKMRSWVRQLTAALVCDGLGRFDGAIEWDGVMAWSPNFVESDQPVPMDFAQVVSTLSDKRTAQAKFDALNWVDGWSAYPREYPPTIYSFDLHIESEFVIFRHRFYNRYTWYVMFPVSQTTTVRLRAKSLEHTLARSRRRNYGLEKRSS